MEVALKYFRKSAKECRLNVVLVTKPVINLSSDESNSVFVWAVDFIGSGGIFLRSNEEYFRTLVLIITH